MFNNNNMLGNMNMNPMGMNNQLMTNFVMDETAMKIKSIIDPYEKKISELEKIIKQKDFEILVLKEKINKYKKNQMNMNNQNNMNNNLNMMNPMMANNNANWMDFYNNNDNNNNNNMNFGSFNLNNNQNQINPLLPNMNVSFNFNGMNFNESCNYDEKIKTVCGRFCRKMKINFKNYNFMWNSKVISSRRVSQLTIAQTGIVNNSKISVKIKANDNFAKEETDSDGECECESGGLMYNCSFRDTSGQTRNVVINPEHSVSTLLKKYLFKIGESNEFGKNNFVFIWNNSRIDYNDKTKIKKYFNDYTGNVKIIVNHTNYIIGG